MIIRLRTKNQQQDPKVIESNNYLFHSSPAYQTSRKNSKPWATSEHALESSLTLRIFLDTSSFNPGLPDITTAPSIWPKEYIQ